MFISYNVSFEGKGQLGVISCSKISSRKTFCWFEFHWISNRSIGHQFRKWIEVGLCNKQNWKAFQSNYKATYAILRAQEWLFNLDKEEYKVPTWKEGWVIKVSNLPLSKILNKDQNSNFYEFHKQKPLSWDFLRLR